MSTLSELGDYLSTTLSLIQSTQLFLGSRPDAGNDPILVIYQYPGGDPEYVQNKFTPNVERAQIQVVARAEDYDAADRLCARAWAALAPIRNVTISGTKYRSIMVQGRGVIGVDTNNRTLVAFNATVEKEVSLVA